MTVDTTFIIPALNSEKTIGATIESILNLYRGGRHCEVILVDNGSCDRTVEIARKFDIQIVSCKKKGAGSARNFGVAAAKGKFLAFIDSDVVLDKMWLDILRRRLDEAHFGIALGQVIPDGEKNFLNVYRKKLNQSRYCGTAISVVHRNGVGPAVNTAACIYRKDFFVAIGGFDESLARFEDTDLSTRLFLSGGNIVADRRAMAKVYFDRGVVDYLLRFYHCGRAQRFCALASRMKTSEAYRVILKELFSTNLSGFSFFEKCYHRVSNVAGLLGVLRVAFSPTSSANITDVDLSESMRKIFVLSLDGKRFRPAEDISVICIDQKLHLYSMFGGAMNVLDLAAPCEQLRSNIVELKKVKLLQPTEDQFISM